MGEVDAPRAALTDALDHVPFGDEEEAYLVRMAQAAENPALREFATEVLKDFELEALDEEEESELVG